MKIGQYNTLRISDEQSQGLYLADDEGERVLLPRRQVPDQWQIGDELSVFLYLDSDERPIATRQRPRVQLNQVAKLTVTDVNNVGAYLDWGLAKDLLLPFSEQQQRAAVGDNVIVYVTQDDFGRLLATTRLNRFIKDEVTSPWPDAPAQYQMGDQVRAILTQKTDLGYKAVVDHQYWGVIHHSQIRTAVRVGQTVSAYVRRIREDDRLDLALEPIGHTRTQQLAKRILQNLQKGNGSLGLGDHSPADLIELHFGASKRAFKMAIGHLLKAGDVVKTPNGIELASSSTQSLADKKTQSRTKGKHQSKPTQSSQSDKTSKKRGTSGRHPNRSNKQDTSAPDEPKSVKSESAKKSAKRVYRNQAKKSDKTLSLRKP